MGLQAGITAFNAGDISGRDLFTREERNRRFELAWHLYRNTMWSPTEIGGAAGWMSEKVTRELYKYTRLIFNPCPLVTDFHVDNIWRAGRARENYEHLVTPVTEQTDEALVAAIAQIDQWSGWRAQSRIIKRYTAALGSCLVEGVDDPRRQKVYHRAHRPELVTDINRNDSGDVNSYVIEYDVWDPEKETTFRFRKEADRESTRYFRDDKPWAPGPGRNAVEPNRYGFCFAVWLQHDDTGELYGEPAFTHYTKLDEANSLASHLHDHIHKAVESPKLIAGASEMVPIIGGSYDPKTGIITPHDTRLEWVVMKTTAQATVHDLAGHLALAEAHPYLTELLASFANEYPELQAPMIVEKHSQLSGAALERMLTPAQNKLDASQAGYNLQLVKLRQMQIAVAGDRYYKGSWNRTSQQAQPFAKFGLESYTKGDLNFELQRTLLIQLTEDEIVETATKRAILAKQLADIQVPRDDQWKAAGYSQEQIAAMAPLADAEQKAEQTRLAQEQSVNNQLG